MERESQSPDWSAADYLPKKSGDKRNMKELKDAAKEEKRLCRIKNNYVPACDDVMCNVCRKYVWEKSPQNRKE